MPSPSIVPRDLVPQPPPSDARAAAALLLRQAVQAGLTALPAGADAVPEIVRAAPESLSLPMLAERIAGCTLCKLAGTRQLTVPGEGASRARLMVIGEGPGAEEDRTGRPFVGAAGQLLDRILQSGMGLRREEVFIANVLKCRPPGNRDPEPDEVGACLPYLEAQIRLVQPDLLLALGRHAAHALLESTASVQKLRGLIHTRPGQGQRVLVTFHPAYLLRNPAAKKDCWQDIQLGMDFLGLPRPTRTEPAQEPGNQPSSPD